MAKKTSEVDSRMAAIVRCSTVSDSEYGDTIVPCQAGKARRITAAERDQILKLTAFVPDYMLVEMCSDTEIDELIDKAQARAQAQKEAAVRRALAEEKRRKTAELARKRRRLAKLEELSKQ